MQLRIQLLQVLHGLGQLGQHAALQQLAPGFQGLRSHVAAGQHEEVEDVVDDWGLGGGGCELSTEVPMAKRKAATTRKTTGARKTASKRRTGAGQRTEIGSNAYSF